MRCRALSLSCFCVLRASGGWPGRCQRHPGRGPAAAPGAGVGKLTGDSANLRPRGRQSLNQTENKDHASMSTFAASIFEPIPRVEVDVIDMNV